MRPPQEVSQAVLTALALGPCTLRDVCERAQVGYKAARASLGNLKRAKKVQICGQEKRAHAKGWCRLYELVDVDEAPFNTPAGAGAKVLAATLSAWCQTPPQCNRPTSL